MLRVTPIYGSRFDSNGASEPPSCTLVEYGGVKVLWNVGWWPNGVTKGTKPETIARNPSDSASAASSFPALPDHDCLVLADSTLNALGGLPLYHQRHPNVPMYATFPTVKMGQMSLYDLHAALCLDGSRPPFSLEQMDDAFAKLRTIKYSQTIVIANPDTNQPSLSITAHRAGHVVGGAFYVLQRLQDETVVVLTSRYHIARELHLDSSTLLKYGAAPDVLVTYPGGPAMKHLSKLYSGTSSMSRPSRVVRGGTNKELIETILSVLRRDGHVLMPVDASGRVLELILLLSQHWDRHRLGAAYNLCWLGPMVQNTLDFCRSQLEWMAGSLGNEFDSQLGKGHPYALRNVHLCSSMEELDAVISQNSNNPTCVLASGLTLDHGPARDLLLRWADNTDHAIVFTDSAQCFSRQPDDILHSTQQNEQNPSGSEPPMLVEQDNVDEDAMAGSAIGPDMKVSQFNAATQLLQKWCEAKLEGREMDDSIMIDVQVPHRAPLQGAELKAFLAGEEAARQKQKQEEEKRAMLREVELAKGQLRLGEDEATTTDTSKAALSSKSSTIAGTRPKKKSRFDSSLFLLFSKPLHLTFEVREEAVGVGQSDSTAKYGIGESVGRSGEVLEDDYGIAVIPDRFTDIVSGVDPSKFAGGSGRIGEEVLRRGFGFGVDANKQNVSGIRRKAVDGEVGDLEDEMDEQALEAVDLSEGNGIIRGRNGRAPTKVTTITRRLEVLAEIAYVPLEGRVGARAARQSVRALQPRQVVVLGGPAKEGQNIKDMVDEVQVLGDAAKTFGSGGTNVTSPSDGETAELDVGHAAYSVRLVDNPYQTRQEKESQEEIPDPVEPFEAKVGACNVSLLDCIATGQKVALDGSIVLAPRPPSASINHSALYISDGEVLLTDLRSELIAQGMKAEYSAQAGYSKLVVNGKIVVKKMQDSGKLDLEGPLCEDFYTVRSVVCGQYVTF